MLILKKKIFLNIAILIWFLKTIFMLSIYFIPFAFIISGFIDSWWVNLILWSLMGFGMAGIGMSVMHDANHGSYSKNKKGQCCYWVISLN